MKSIFMGGEKIFSVYSEAIQEKLAQTCGALPGRNFRAEEYAEFSDVEFIFSTWGMPRFSAEEIRSYFPSLRAVFYAAGSVQGFARPFLDCGVRVFSAWAANAIPVAAYTVSQILLAAKGFFPACRMMKSGDPKSAKKAAAAFPGNFGAKIGVLGAGQIGSLVISGLAFADPTIFVYDPFLSAERADALGVIRAELDEVFSVCDVVSNHLANKPQTVGILNYALFSRMPEHAVFINTGRGAQVVEADLVRALSECPGRTALLDVTLPEPPEQKHPFYRMENVILTPHIAGSMGRELWRMGEYMMREAERAKNGLPSRYEVTKEMLETMA